MLISSQIDEFHRNGFLNGGRILTDEELEALRTDLESILERGPDSFSARNHTVSFRNMSQREDKPLNSPFGKLSISGKHPQPLSRLIYHPAIVKGISQLTDAPNLMVWHDQIQYKPPTTVEQPDGIKMHRCGPSFFR